MQDINTTTEAGISEIAEIVAKILNENDIDFIENHITISKLMEFGEILKTINYQGIPEATKAQKKNINLGKV